MSDERVTKKAKRRKYKVKMQHKSHLEGTIFPDRMDNNTATKADTEDQPQNLSWRALAEVGRL